MFSRSIRKADGYFASNSVNTTFSNISIKTLESDFSQSSWSGYKEYYSSDITKNALTKVQEGTNWAIEDGVIRRKAQEPEWMIVEIIWIWHIYI